MDSKVWRHYLRAIGHALAAFGMGLAGVAADEAAPGSGIADGVHP